MAADEAVCKLPRSRLMRCCWGGAGCTGGAPAQLLVLVAVASRVDGGSIAASGSVAQAGGGGRLRKGREARGEEVLAEVSHDGAGEVWLEDMEARDEEMLARSEAARAARKALAAGDAAVVKRRRRWLTRAAGKKLARVVETQTEKSYRGAG